MPILSIITINLNNKVGLEKTIRSVINQKFKDFEFIVIDGGSNDGSSDLIESYKTKINYYVSEKDSGIYNAQNKGILASSGTYLLFLNSGDFLCNNGVLSSIFSEELISADILYGNMKINWGNNKITVGKMPAKITVEHMFKDTLWHPVSFIKRALFDKLGLYNETYKIVADYDFFFKAIVINKVSLKYINSVVSEYNTEGLSSNPNNREIEKDERKRVLNSYLSSEEIEKLEKGMNKNKLISFFKHFLKGK